MTRNALLRLHLNPALRCLGASLLGAALASPAAAMTPFQPLPSNDVGLSPVHCLPEGWPADRIHGNGRLNDNKKTLLRLPVRKATDLARAVVLKADNALYLGYEQSAGGDGYGSMVCKLSADGKKRHWCTAAPVSNIVMTLTDEGLIYVMGLDFVGKLQTQSGKFDWQVRGLWSRDRDLNIFRMPVIKGEDVQFVASANGNAPYKRVIVGRDTGKLKTIEAFPLNTEALPPEGPSLQGHCALK